MIYKIFLGDNDVPQVWSITIRNFTNPDAIKESRSNMGRSISDCAKFAGSLDYRQGLHQPTLGTVAEKFERLI